MSDSSLLEKDNSAADSGLDTEMHRGLGLFDATMVVVGAMIGSGIFIVPATMAQEVGSPGWLLVAWIITGLLTVTAALSYGELAGMMPRAGGQYVYLREAFSPLLGFLYGWALFLVIQTGFIAAVAVAFARSAGVLWPAIDEKKYLLGPWHPPLLHGYALSVSTAQLAAIALIAGLTFTNIAGLRYGKWVQNLFTIAKTGALLALIVVGLFFGRDANAVAANLSDPWTVRGVKPIDAATGLSAASAFGLFIALCVTQTRSLFSSDAWNSITFAAGEVREPRRTLPLALALGTTSVIAIYLLTNLAYLAVLPFEVLQAETSDLIAVVMLRQVYPETGAALMAVAIMISTFGCDNGLILAGARAYYAMARDGLFFRKAGQLNAARVPGWSLVLQGIWASALVLPRTYDGEKYGNLYNDLLDYIISAVLLFYVLTLAGLFRLRYTQPNASRPYRAFGYPVVPAAYIVGATILVAVLFVYRPLQTWPGLVLVLLGLPVYLAWRRR